MKTILVLTDFSESSRHAAEYALYIAVDIHAKVLLYNAYYVPQAAPVETGMFQAYYGDYEVYEEESMKRLKAQTEALKSKFNLIGINQLPEIVCKNAIGVVGDNISAILDKYDIWMIVMGDKHNDSFFSRFVFGSDSINIIKHASCPVLIIPQRADFSFLKRIVFAYPSLEAANLKCLNFLTELGAFFNTDIEVLHVFQKDAERQEEQRYSAYFNSMKNDIKYEKINYHVIKEKDIPEAIEKFAESIDSSIISMLYRKHPFFEQIFHKSIVDKVMGHHKFPLLVFPDEYVKEHLSSAS